MNADDPATRTRRVSLRTACANPRGIRVVAIIAVALGGGLSPAVSGESPTTDNKSRAIAHWAFQPLEFSPASRATRTVGGKGSIDGFIGHRLREARLAPGHEASPTTLIRRVAFVLTGLPPTPEEIEAFVSDQKPGAYERMM